MNTHNLVLCRSPDGWSLHPAGSTDEAIAEGEAPFLLNGEGEPTQEDYDLAALTFAIPRSRFRECLGILGWSPQSLASQLGMGDREPRRWYAGQPIPPRIAAWLDDLATYHQAHPPPPAPPSRREPG